LTDTSSPATVHARYDLLTFGETMLRLTGEAGRRLDDSGTLHVSVGGAESNVCVALARLGRSVAWLSALPENPLGRRIERELRGHGVDTSHVIWSSTDRLGIYFLDPGAAPRPTRVLYDRSDSAVARIDPDAIDASLVQQSRALHLTGITPALSDGCERVCDRLASAAVEAGVPVVIDVNYRARLWSAWEASAGLELLLQCATLVFCGAADARTLWGIEGEPDVVGRALLDRSSAELVVITVAEDGAYAVTRDERVYLQASLPVEIVDPVGAGDAFAAGFLHRWLDDRSDIPAALRSATALAALKMTIFGDHALISQLELDDALALLDGAGTDIDR